jgi:hypothetical protein
MESAMKKIAPGSPCQINMPSLTGMLFRVMALFACLLLLPFPALAATVYFDSGSFDFLVGNPYIDGDTGGIGGVNDPDRPDYNPYASDNTVIVTAKR